MLAHRHGAGPDAKSRTALFGANRGTVFLLKACHLEPMMRSVHNARADCLLCRSSRHGLLRLLLYVGRFNEADAQLIAIDPS